MASGLMRRGRLWIRCRFVAVAARLADVMLAADRTAQTALVWPPLQGLLGLDSADFCGLVTTAVGALPEMERVYETPILNRHAAHALMEQARVILSPRSITSHEQARRLQSRNDQPEGSAQGSKDQSRKDASE